MTSPKFDALFDGPPRQPESPLTEREMDIAASIQEVTEEIMLRMRPARAPRDRAEAAVPGRRRGARTASATAASCAKGRSTTSGFSRPPATPAARSASPLFIWHQLLDQPAGAPRPADRQPGSLLGPRYSDDEIRAFLDSIGAQSTSECRRTRSCATSSPDLHRRGTVVGWFQGRMEFGPRALGSRSILGDARSQAMQSVMNLKIKFRESFRPFAPVGPAGARARVLRDAAAGGQPVHAARRAGAGVAARRRRTAQAAELRGHRQAEGGAVRASRRSRTSTTRRASRPSIPSGTAATTRLIKRFEQKTGCSGHHQHQLQRARRADRVPSGRGVPLLHGDQHGRAGAGALRASSRSAAERARHRSRGVSGAVRARLIRETAIEPPWP